MPWLCMIWSAYSRMLLDDSKLLTWSMAYYNVALKSPKVLPLLTRQCRRQQMQLRTDISSNCWHCVALCTYSGTCCYHVIGMKQILWTHLHLVTFMFLFSNFCDISSTLSLVAVAFLLFVNYIILLFALMKVHCVMIWRLTQQHGMNFSWLFLYFQNRWVISSFPFPLGWLWMERLVW